MSWLTAMTGKAEDFLNKLDKSAANAFHIEEETVSKKVTLPPVASEEFYRSSVPHPQSLTTSSSVPARLYESNRLGQPTALSAPKVTSKSSRVSTAASVEKTASRSDSSSSKKLNTTSTSKKDSDEALFDFLNSKDPSEGKKKRVKTIASVSDPSPSSVSSQSHTQLDVMKLSASSSGQEEPPGTWSSGSWSLGDDDVCASQSASSETMEAEPQENERNSPTYSNESADVEALADAMKESPTGSINSVPETEHQDAEDTHVSAMELENSLLKNEVSSLSQELAAVIERAKKAQTELVKTKEKLAQYTNNASLHDQLLQEYQSRETDFHEAIKAKDSQLAVLRVQLEEADRTASMKRKEIDNLQSEHARLLQDKSSASGIHSQAVDSLQYKLTEMEGVLAREKQAHKHYQQEVMDRQSRLEQEQKSLTEALTAAERKISEEKAKAAEAQGQLKTLKTTLESARQEMTEYKEKASRILQSKERLISSLRDGSASSESTEGISSLEHESIRQERDMLREELQKNKLTLDSLRTELQDLDIQLQQESSTARDTIQSLEESLAEEKRHREEVEQELLSQKEELQYAMDDLRNQKVNFQSRISNREAEIEKLRNQLTTKSISSTSESELESRVRSLTESLIQKQTMLEALSTEKNSLTVQLERLGQQYRDAENTLMRSAIASVSVGDRDDDMRHRLPTFMREGASDTEMTRRVKHYISSVDKFSIRMGVFLRRYPVARVFVLAYMAMLHLWVMIVLMTYQPEMHHEKTFMPNEK